MVRFHTPISLRSLRIDFSSTTQLAFVTCILRMLIRELTGVVPRSTTLLTAVCRRLRAHLHGTIFVSCDKLTTGLGHDLRLVCTSEKCRSILKHVLKRCGNRKSCRRPAVSLSHATKIVPCKSALKTAGCEDSFRCFLSIMTWVTYGKALEWRENCDCILKADGATYRKSLGELKHG